MGKYSPKEIATRTRTKTRDRFALGGKRKPAPEVRCYLTDNVCGGAPAHFARGSGRIWEWTAIGLPPLPRSISQGARSPLELHSPRPFQPTFGSSMRPSKPLA